MALIYTDSKHDVPDGEKNASCDQQNPSTPHQLNKGSRRKRFSLKKKLLFSVIVAGLFFGSLEFVCFLTKPLYINFRKLGLPAYAVNYMPSTIKYTLRENVLSKPDKELLFRVEQNPSGLPMQGYSGINAHGFRGNIYDPSLINKDETKIMILGDSCAFGWGIRDYGLTFQSILEKRLNQRQCDYKVYNFSQPGYSSSQGRIIFEKWFSRVSPDLLIIYLGWNDIWETPLLTDSQNLNLFKYTKKTPLK